MSFRDTENTESSNASRISNVSNRSNTQGLPTGFSWQPSVNSVGELSLNIIDTATGRVVIYGL